MNKLLVFILILFNLNIISQEDYGKQIRLSSWVSGSVGTDLSSMVGFGRRYFKNINFDINYILRINSGDRFILSIEPGLYIDQYKITESSAPNGYIKYQLNNLHCPVTLNYNFERKFSVFGGVDFMVDLNGFNNFHLNGLTGFNKSLNRNNEIGIKFSINKLNRIESIRNGITYSMYSSAKTLNNTNKSITLRFIHKI